MGQLTDSLGGGTYEQFLYNIKEGQTVWLIDELFQDHTVCSAKVAIITRDLIQIEGGLKFYRNNGQMGGYSNDGRRWQIIMNENHRPVDPKSQEQPRKESGLFARLFGR